MAKKVALDNMILTKNAPTTAGSKMLEGYMSLFDAEVVTRLVDGGYTIGEKTSVGEFSIDLIGETAYDADKLPASKDILANGEADAVVSLDVNGATRRIAAQNDLVSIKPTYGTVSRYGTIPVVCSGESVSVLAKKSDDCKEVLAAISGYDSKDGTSLPDEMRKTTGGEVKKVLLITSFLDSVDDEVKAKIDKFVKVLAKNGVEVVNKDDEIIKKSRIAWNILMCAELCNNVSRYDGVKYGYRANEFSNIDEMYTNSRTESFGELLKTAILFGSETLSTDNYFKVYDKALRTRRVIKEDFNEIFKSFDAVLLPACSKYEYKEELGDKNASFSENMFTAPASITGLPAVVVGGVQIVGDVFSENKLLEIAKMCEKEEE